MQDFDLFPQIFTAIVPFFRRFWHTLTYCNPFLSYANVQMRTVSKFKCNKYILSTNLHQKVLF